jgi:hypothetical protein
MLLPSHSPLSAVYALLSRRYHSLRQLFNIPDSFVEEFVVQEPELLCLSVNTLQAKFDSLLRRWVSVVGRFVALCTQLTMCSYLFC